MSETTEIHKAFRTYRRFYAFVTAEPQGYGDEKIVVTDVKMNDNVNDNLPYFGNVLKNEKKRQYYRNLVSIPGIDVNKYLYSNFALFKGTFWPAMFAQPWTLHNYRKYDDIIETIEQGTMVKLVDGFKRLEHENDIFHRDTFKNLIGSVHPIVWSALYGDRLYLTINAFSTDDEFINKHTKYEKYKDFLSAITRGVLLLKSMKRYDRVKSQFNKIIGG